MQALCRPPSQPEELLKTRAPEYWCSPPHTTVSHLLIPVVTGGFQPVPGNPKPPNMPHTGGQSACKLICQPALCMIQIQQINFFFADSIADCQQEDFCCSEELRQPYVSPSYQKGNKEKHVSQQCVCCYTVSTASMLIIITKATLADSTCLSVVFKVSWKAD